MLIFKIQKHGQQKYLLILFRNMLALLFDRIFGLVHMHLHVEYFGKIFMLVMDINTQRQIIKLNFRHYQQMSILMYWKLLKSMTQHQKMKQKLVLLKNNQKKKKNTRKRLKTKKKINFLFLCVCVIRRVRFFKYNSRKYISIFE